MAKRNQRAAVMNRLEYFKARLEATITPSEVLKLLRAHPESICVMDVRTGPAKLLGDRIIGALQIPQNVVLLHTGRLPKRRTRASTKNFMIRLRLSCFPKKYLHAILHNLELRKRGVGRGQAGGDVSFWSVGRSECLYTACHGGIPPAESRVESIAVYYSRSARPCWLLPICSLPRPPEPHR